MTTSHSGAAAARLRLGTAPDSWGDRQAALDKTRRVAELTSALGGRDVVFVPGPGYRDDTDPRYTVAAGQEVGR
jgi:inosose dehydratase